MATATERQIEVLRAIAEQSKAHGYPPTFREVGDQLGIGVNAVRAHYAALTRKGLIVTAVRKSRSVRITPAGLKLLK